MHALETRWQGFEELSCDLWKLGLVPRNSQAAFLAIFSQEKFEKNFLELAKSILFEKGTCEIDSFRGSFPP